MGFSKQDTLESRPDFIKKFVKSYGKTENDILAADATETAASAKVAHQGWTIPAGGNGNPNAMRETIIAMNIGSDIGTDDDAGLGIGGGGGGGGGGGVSYTTLYHYGQPFYPGYSTNNTYLQNVSMNSDAIKFDLYGVYADSAPPYSTYDTIPWLYQWKGYGAADDGTGNYATGYGNEAINMMKIYSGTNAGFTDDGYNLDGSCNFFFFTKVHDNYSQYMFNVELHFTDYIGAASGHGAPWDDPGHPGYPLLSAYPGTPPLTAAGDQPQKLFDIAYTIVQSPSMIQAFKFKFDVAPANPNSMPKPEGYVD